MSCDRFSKSPKRDFYSNFGTPHHLLIHFAWIQYFPFLDEKEPQMTSMGYYIYSLILLSSFFDRIIWSLMRLNLRYIECNHLSLKVLFRGGCGLSRLRKDHKQRWITRSAHRSIQWNNDSWKTKSKKYVTLVFSFSFHLIFIAIAKANGGRTEWLQSNWKLLEAKPIQYFMHFLYWGLQICFQ